MCDRVRLGLMIVLLMELLFEVLDVRVRLAFFAVDASLAAETASIKDLPMALDLLQGAEWKVITFFVQLMTLCSGSQESS